MQRSSHHALQMGSLKIITLREEGKGSLTMVLNKRGNVIQQYWESDMWHYVYKMTRSLIIIVVHARKTGNFCCISPFSSADGLLWQRYVGLFRVGLLHP